MSAHTPGPWEVFDSSPGSVWKADAQIASCDWLIENDELDFRVKSQRERRANARLIAAAPELLEALVRVLGSQAVMNPDPDSDPDVRFARAAIARATGAQP